MQTNAASRNAIKFKVTRQFIGGILDGLTHTEITTVKFSEGWVCEKPVGGSPYKIISVQPIGENS